MRVSADDSPAPSFRQELTRLATVAEIGLFLTVPVVLAIVFLLPEATRQALIFDTGNPTVLTAFTAHYVHLTTSHLVGNLFIYAGAVGVGYPLALLGGFRRMYLSLVMAVLLAYPFVLSMLHLALLGSGGIVGFSGLVLALVGLLPIVLFAYLRARIEGAVSINDAPSLFFFGIAAVAWRTAAPGSVILPLVLVSLGLGVLYLIPLAARLIRQGGRTDPRPLGWGYVELPVAVVLLYFLALALGFSIGPIGTDGSRTNLVVHLLAYALGFIGGYLTDRSIRALAPATAPPPPPPS